MLSLKERGQVEFSERQDRFYDIPRVKSAVGTLPAGEEGRICGLSNCIGRCRQRNWSVLVRFYPLGTWLAWSRMDMVSKMGNWAGPHQVEHRSMVLFVLLCFLTHERTPLIPLANCPGGPSIIHRKKFAAEYDERGTARLSKEYSTYRTSQSPNRA